ncbi:MAG: helix-turn-helix transcriptional regulator [Gammaproteobacteria bacterium]
MSVNPDSVLCRMPSVLKKTTLSKSEIYKRINEGTFPLPVRLGPCSVAWVESEIEAWIIAQIAASRKSSEVMK